MIRFPDADRGARRGAPRSHLTRAVVRARASPARRTPAPQAGRSLATNPTERPPREDPRQGPLGLRGIPHEQEDGRARLGQAHLVPSITTYQPQRRARAGRIEAGSHFRKKTSWRFRWTTRARTSRKPRQRSRHSATEKTFVSGLVSPSVIRVR